MPSEGNSCTEYGPLCCVLSVNINFSSVNEYSKIAKVPVPSKKGDRKVDGSSFLLGWDFSEAGNF